MFFGTRVGALLHRVRASSSGFGGAGFPSGFDSDPASGFGAGGGLGVGVGAAFAPRWLAGGKPAALLSIMVLSAWQNRQFEFLSLAASSTLSCASFLWQRMQPPTGWQSRQPATVG